MRPVLATIFFCLTLTGCASLSGPLLSEDAEVRTSALNKLDGLDAAKKEKLVDNLIGYLEPDPDHPGGTAEAEDYLTRLYAVDALKHMGPSASKAVPILIKNLDRTDPFSVADFYRSICLALGNMGPRAEEAIPALIHTLHYTDPFSANADGSNVGADSAAIALEKIGKPAVPFLLKDLDAYKYPNNRKSRESGYATLRVISAILGPTESQDLIAQYDGYKNNKDKVEKLKQASEEQLAALKLAVKAAEQKYGRTFSHYCQHPLSSLIRHIRYWPETEAEKDCLYPLSGRDLIAGQKVAKGYLITWDEEAYRRAAFEFFRMNNRDDYMPYSVAFLETDDVFASQGPLAGYAYFVGTHEYTALDGFKTTVPAFKTYDGPLVK